MSEQRPNNTLALDLALTARCPLRCRFCTVDKRPGAELTAGEWARVMAALAAVRPVRLISLEGGEPLLRPDLADIARAALACAGQIKIVTGGSIPFGALPRELARSPRLTLEVSVDGPRHLHDDLRDGSFDAAWNFIHTARVQGARLRLRTVVSTLNLEAIEAWLGAVDRELKDHLLPVGFRFDTLIAPETLEPMGGPHRRQPVRRTGGLDWVPSPVEVAALYDRLRARRFRRLRFEQTEPFRGCGVGRLPFISFDPEGKFSFCCEAPRGFGSIRESSAEAILALLDTQMAALPCRGCTHFKAGRCDGCWTGQKCGMVGAWELPGCRELLDSAGSRSQVGSDLCQPRFPAASPTSVCRRQSCTGT